MALRVCNVTGCPELIPQGQGRCANHQRGTSSERGYGGKGHKRFRYQVLARDPICVRCRVARSTDADHYPRERTELIRLGLNPDDPAYGRGLCHRCHSIETAESRPGGWNLG